MCAPTLNIISPINNFEVSAVSTWHRRAVDQVTKFAMACYGSRGDVEPSLAVGRELVRRGHDVCIAVPPDLTGFVEAGGVSAVPYGPSVETLLKEDHVRNLWTNFFHNPVRLLRELWEPIIAHWDEVSAALKSLADSAELLSTGINFEQAAANVAEYLDIPLVSLHHFPMRANGQLIPSIPSPLVRFGGRASEWLFWRLTREVENAQRHKLGLPKAKTPSQRRIAERRSLEIQAYDEVCVPGLAVEWAKWGDRRPFVGALTMELATNVDEEVMSWIAAGSSPICFATGSIPVESPAEMVRMIAAACTQLGERALVCFGGTELNDLPRFDHVKVVGAVNYAAIFPLCRVIVHHGGSGTTAASLRAGIPTLILWSSADQPYWGNQVKRLKVGAARRFSTINTESLVADLRRILSADYAARAHALSAQMTKPAMSVAKTAELFENAVARETLSGGR